MATVKDFLFQCRNNEKKISVDYLLSMGKDKVNQNIQTRIINLAAKGFDHDIVNFDWEACECIKGGYSHQTKLKPEDYPNAPKGFKWWMFMYDEYKHLGGNIFYPINAKEGEIITVIYDGVHIYEELLWIHKEKGLFEEIFTWAFLYDNLLFNLDEITQHKNLNS